jgi:hypothetical protein
VKDQVSGFVSKLLGNAGDAFFIDRDAGTARTLTFWETEEAAAETTSSLTKAAPAPLRRQVELVSVAPTRS